MSSAENGFASPSQNTPVKPNGKNNTSHTCKTKLDGLKIGRAQKALMQGRTSPGLWSSHSDPQEHRPSSAVPQHKRPWAVAQGSTLLNRLNTAERPLQPASPPVGSGLFYSPLPIQQGHGAVDEFPPPKRT